MGAMHMIDGGALDDKIIAVPFSDSSYSEINSTDDLPHHIFDEMMHFFSVYKQLENKQTAVKSLLSREEAYEIIRECIRSYNEKFGDNKEKLIPFSVLNSLPAAA